MKRKLLLTAILTLLCCTLLIAGASADLQGDGTESAPYQISTAEELREFTQIVNGTHESIDLKTQTFIADTSLYVITMTAVKVDGEVSYVKPGGSFTMPPAPSKPGYIFVGWTDGKIHTSPAVWLT